MHDDIRRRAFAAFGADAATPPLTLRGASAVDSYDAPPPHDPAADRPTDAYLEAYAYWGLPHLDPASWRHYLPYLIDYALRHPDDPRMVAEGLLHALRPPDRDPPRLGSLTPQQEAAIVAFLDALAFDDGSPHQAFAMQVLEEWWLPHALYRRRPEDAA